MMKKKLEKVTYNECKEISGGLTKIPGTIEIDYIPKPEIFGTNTDGMASKLGKQETTS